MYFVVGGHGKYLYPVPAKERRSHVPIYINDRFANEKKNDHGVNDVDTYVLGAGIKAL